MPTLFANGATLFYDQVGTGPDLILISGFTASHEAWRPLLPYLVKHFTVTVFDNRGVGQSSIDDVDYSIDLMADDIIAIMDHVGIRSAFIAGHSMGGFILQSLSARYSGRVRKAIFVCGRLMENPRYALHNQLNQAIASSQIDDSALYKSQALFLFGSRALGRAGFINQFIEFRRLNPQSDVGMQGQYQAIRAFDRLRYLDAVGKVVSCCAVYGEDDLIAPPQTADFIKQVIPTCDVRVIAGCGHIPQMERPKAFAEIICQWCID